MVRSHFRSRGRWPLRLSDGAKVIWEPNGPPTDHRQVPPFSPQRGVHRGHHGAPPEAGAPVAPHPRLLPRRRARCHVLDPSPVTPPEILVLCRLVWQIGVGLRTLARTPQSDSHTRANTRSHPPRHTHVHTGAQIHAHAHAGTGTHTENQDQQTVRITCVQKGPVADVLRDGADRVPAVLAPRGPSPHAPPPPLPPLRPRHPGPQGMPWGFAGDTLDPLYCDPFPTNNRCGSACPSPAGRWTCVFDSIVELKFDVLSTQAKVFLATYGSRGLLPKPCLVPYNQRNSTQTAQKKLGAKSRLSNKKKNSAGVFGCE